LVGDIRVNENTNIHFKIGKIGATFSEPFYTVLSIQHSGYASEKHRVVIIETTRNVSQSHREKVTPVIFLSVQAFQRCAPSFDCKNDSSRKSSIRKAHVLCDLLHSLIANFSLYPEIFVEVTIASQLANIKPGDLYKVVSLHFTDVK